MNAGQYPAFLALQDYKSRHFRANAPEADIRPVTFVKETPGGVEVRPYEKHGYSRYPKEHMTDELLGAVGVIAESLGSAVDSFVANRFYSDCWYSKNLAQLQAVLRKWQPYLAEHGITI
jgi:hypothetical protein